MVGQPLLSCVKDWILIVEKLILIAESQPQLAYSALTKSIQSKWTYLQRVTPECGPLFEPLEVLIAERLLPTIFGSEITPHERTLFSLPTCMGGLKVVSSEFYFHKPITVHIELYLFYHFIHFLLYIGQY